MNKNTIKSKGRFIYFFKKQKNEMSQAKEISNKSIYSDNQGEKKQDWSHEMSSQVQEG